MASIANHDIHVVVSFFQSEVGDRLSLIPVRGFRRFDLGIVRS